MTVEAARRGDRAAQAALLRELQDVWFRFCLGLLGGNAEDAHDAVQETALRFLRDLPRFRGASSISTWSMGIAINVTREIRRKSKPMKLLFDGGGEDEGGPSSAAATLQAADDGPDRQAALDESKSLLQQTLADLPQRQREALLLRFFEDKSVEETAEAMDCAAGTVKATVHQALRALKIKLKQLA